MNDSMPALPSYPLFAHKDYAAPSIFTPANLLREARRQKGLPEGSVPALCVLDPDGDLVEYLHASGQACPHPHWACYHTTLFTWEQDGVEIGIVGRAVGASFTVLVAEELFASGCQFLISITSAGQLLEVAQPPYIVLIERALRDEGTSYHYLPPSAYSTINSALRERILDGWGRASQSLFIGDSWTTDAPFRETEAMIAWGRERGLLAIEMEAAALYALAEARGYSIICFAHITNQMAQQEGDFEKGAANGSLSALSVIQHTIQALRLAHSR